MRKGLFILILLLVAFAGISLTQAQDNENCVPTVMDTMSTLEELCDTMDRNSACYGANDVESETVLDPRPDDFFAAPGDYAELVDLTEIRPLGLDMETGAFGASLLNVQADIPNTIPGQSVLFLLMGDARLTNEAALSGDEDGVDFSPFQSFYFLPSPTGNTNCYEADPILTIQTPGNITVNIVLNGVNTEMSPGTLLTITDRVCTIHRGNIRQGDDVLLANQTVDIFIDDEGAVNVTNLRGISEQEYQRGKQVQDTLNAIARANDWQEQYLTDVTEFAEEPARINIGVCDTTHTVHPGDTVTSIARQYETSVQAIVDANDLANPRLITTGQELCIPGEGTGFVPLNR